MSRFFSRLMSWLGWIVKICLFLAAATWLYLHPGRVSIDWQGTTIETSTGFAALVIFLVLSVFGVVYHGWRLILGWPRLRRRQSELKSLELGYKFLNKGLLAVAAADRVAATKNANKAIEFLPDLALTHLLAAQAAQLQNDDITADKHLAILSQHPEGQIFGLRGQLTRALQRQDSADALYLARQAYQSQPQQPWVIDTLVQLETRQQNWLQAEKILRQALHLGGEETEKWSKDLAAVLCALSDQLLVKNDSNAAMDCAREAIKLQPDWTPAALRVAEIWHRKAYRRRAQKVLLKAWGKAPHPDLVSAWLHVSGGDRNPDSTQDHTTLIERLVNSNPDNAESAMAMARAYYAAGLWGVARQHAQRAIAYRPDRAAYRLMGDIEQEDTNNVQQIHAWLDKAGDAPQEPQWHCAVTGEVFPLWQVLNRRQDFNTIEWQVPSAFAKIEFALTGPDVLKDDKKGE